MFQVLLKVIKGYKTFPLWTKPLKYKQTKWMCALAGDYLQHQCSLLIWSQFFAISVILNSKQFPLDSLFSHLLSAISNSWHLELQSRSRVLGTLHCCRNTVSLSTSHSPPQHSVHIYSSKKRPTIPILPVGVVGKLNSNFPLQNVLAFCQVSQERFVRIVYFIGIPWGFEIVGFERQLHIMIKFQLYDCAKMLTLLNRFFWNVTHYSVQVTTVAFWIQWIIYM